MTMRNGWDEPDLFEATGSADVRKPVRSDSPAPLPTTHRTNVGQGELPLDGGQPDFFDDEEPIVAPTVRHGSPMSRPAAADDDGPAPLPELSVLARNLMDEHGLTSWSFKWDRAVRRAGATHYASRTISLSVPLMRLFPRSEARNTVLHEIAHALAGHSAGHGPTWQRTAVEIGARPVRCIDASLPRVDGEWVGTCPSGHTCTRHRAPKGEISCGRCAPKVFDARFTYSWTWCGTPVLKPGTLVELVGEHAWTGRRAKITKLKDTCYAVLLDDGSVLDVPFIFAALLA